MKKIIGGIITLVIGGTIYSFSQVDVAKNFAKYTGLTQQEAQQYVEGIKKEDMAEWDTIGSNFISDGQKLIEMANNIDCDKYQYKWESNTLNCEEGKSQIEKVGNSSINLGKAYKVLDTKEATKNDISTTISEIDRYNSDLDLSIVTAILDQQTIDKEKKTNLYNKALLQTALESNKE